MSKHTFSQTINLSAKERQASIIMENHPKTIALEASRENCKDILTEIFDEKGNAQCKPLQKILPQLKSKTPITQLRFTMNDFSTKPITIIINYY